MHYLSVEMGGLEPPSKHRTRQLSTRLVFLWLSAEGCRKTGHRPLILKSWAAAEESAAASGLDDTPCSGHNRRKALRDTRQARSLGGPD